MVMGATQVPIVYSAAYGYTDVDEWLDVALGRKPGHIYSRNTNPTIHAFEEKVRLLEGAEAATSFSTGMAAVSNTLFTLLSPGDQVVSVKDTTAERIRFSPSSYRASMWMLNYAIPPTTPKSKPPWHRAARFFISETPTNPTLKILDLYRLAAAGHKVGAIVVADNTFATPVNQNPR